MARTLKRQRGETRTASLHRQLADEIIMGKLAPGTRLDEMSLAKRFGVSRTPVREALQQLVASGLAEKRPHCGVLVARITRERLIDMFETMAELEATCARLAARRMTAPERLAFEQLHRQSAQLVHRGDPDAYEGANLAFHAAIYAGAHNEFLESTTLSVRARLAPFRGAQFRLPERLTRSFSEHEAIVEAIVQGDSARAGDEVLSHLTTVESAAEQYIIDTPAPEAVPSIVR